MKAEGKMVGVDYEAHRRRTNRGPVRVRGQPLNSSSARGMRHEVRGARQERRVAAEPKDGYGSDRGRSWTCRNIFMVDGKLAEHPLGVGSRLLMSDKGSHAMGIVKEGGRRARPRVDFNATDDGRARPSLRGRGGLGARRSRFGLQPLLLRFDAATARLRRDGCCCGSRTCSCRTHRPGTSGFGDGTSSERSRLHVSTSHDAHLGNTAFSPTIRTNNT